MPALEDLALASPAERFDGAGVTLRSRAARGTIVNGAFLVGTNALGLIKAVAVAGLLTTTQYGTWGLLMAAFTTILALGSVGVDDKYVQQDDSDQRRAFEIAFTLQALLGAFFFVAVLVGMPLFAILYGRPAMIAPGMVFALAIPALVLQVPLWTHYRRMNFSHQRRLQAIDPIVSIIAVLALAAAGFGVWALVVGELLGTWCATAAIVRGSPYKLRLRFDRDAVREYARFSWPLFLGALTAVLAVQVPVTVSSHELGIVAVGGLTLATNISLFTTRVDDVVTQALYPAICAVKDRTDLLLEAFWKSNRLALLWAAPVGAAAALFARPFVDGVLGTKWRFAVPLIALFGVNAALNQIGFNWTAFFRARGETRPIAVAGVAGLLGTLALEVPLLILDGLTGLGIGLCGATLIVVAQRLWYLRRVFAQFPVARHVASGVGPTLAAVAAVLALRLFHGRGASVGWTGVEVAVFTTVVVLATVGSQRALLLESLGYLRRRATASA